MKDKMDEIDYEGYRKAWHDHLSRLARPAVVGAEMSRRRHAERRWTTRHYALSCLLALMTVYPTVAVVANKMADGKTHVTEFANTKEAEVEVDWILKLL